MNSRNRAIILFFNCIILVKCFSQVVPPPFRGADWYHAGLRDSAGLFLRTVSIADFGGGGSRTAPENNNALSGAISYFNDKRGIIYFPSGVYNFSQSFFIPDSIVLLGESSTSTTLRFDLGGREENLLNITGNTSSIKAGFKEFALKNSAQILVDNTSGFAKGDFIKITINDSSLVYSDWALKTVGQIVEIKNISADTIFLNSPLRMDYFLDFNPEITKILPSANVGIECLKIERVDATAAQTSNINFEYALNCYVSGVESYNANFAHININSSTNILISGCYIHHAFSYGGNGQGYGVMVQSTSGECLIENNIFNHLRHSMIVQSGANGNVFSYNYSLDPYWNEGSFPTNSAGDITIHGNYPYCNLFEGNIVQNIVIDDSHGINGPYNTIFRNRAELYGIVMANNPPSDMQNLMGNEVTNTGYLKGLYILSGLDNYEFGNNIKGTIKPAGTTELEDTSLYLKLKPHFWTDANSFPSIGTPQPYNQGSIPAKIRYGLSEYTVCQGRHNISGNVTYDNAASTPLAGVSVYLCSSGGNTLDSVITNTEGAYEFKNLINGNYTLKLKTNLKWRKATVTDALMINRAFIGLYNIKSSIRKSASDVNNNKKVDVADALVINRRFIGLINKYSISDWLFEDADFSIAGSDVSLDIKGICAGDVTGSY